MQCDAVLRVHEATFAMTPPADPHMLDDMDSTAGRCAHHRQVQVANGIGRLLRLLELHDAAALRRPVL